MKDWPPYGIIGPFYSKALADTVLELGIPAVNVSDMLSDLEIPQIVMDGYEIGKLVAAMLESIFKGETVGSRRVLVPPKGLVERASTDHFTIENEPIAKAVRFIREHAVEGINVGDVAQITGIGRRVLEQGIRKELGHSPLTEISRVRLRMARRLLAETKLSLTDVSLKSGHRDLNHLSRVFREKLNITPLNYRRKFSSSEMSNFNFGSMNG